MSKLAINFTHDSNLSGLIAPILGNVTMEVNYLLEQIISKDEVTYKEKWGHTLIHTERDRVVSYMAEYLLKPLREPLGTTYIFDGTPESMSAIVEDIRKKIDSDDVVSNIEVDFEGLEFTCKVMKGEALEDVTLTASELVDTAALEFMQLKLKGLYKSAVDGMLQAIETGIGMSGMFYHVSK